MEVDHQKFVSRRIKSADGGTGLFAQDHQANGVERRSANLKMMPSRQPDVKTRGKSGRSTDKATRKCKI